MWGQILKNRILVGFLFVCYKTYRRKKDIYRFDLSSFLFFLLLKWTLFRNIFLSLCHNIYLLIGEAV